MHHRIGIAHGSAVRASIGSLLLLLIAGGAERTHAQSIDAPPSPVAMVDALNGVFGPQKMGRAIHAKGIVVHGTFAPGPEASNFSKAAHLRGRGTIVTARFSDFAGIPAVSDTDPLATPRGIAIRFELKGGGHTDIVAHSFNGFPTSTAEQFRELMVALGTSPPGSPQPTAADVFMSSHPAAKRFFSQLPPPPLSFATVEYYGVNSFRFTNARGRVRVGRYQIVPADGVQYLPKDQLTKAEPNYLTRELTARLSKRPAVFTLQVQMADAGDAVADPATTWPDSRSIVPLGTITLAAIDDNSAQVEQRLMFSPAALTDGIEAADPMVAARNSAYAVSYQRRQPAPGAR